MSSARPITRDDLMPGAGSSSYSVTTGPGRALVISPRTPKSCSTASSDLEFCCSTSLLSVLRSDAFGRGQHRNRRQREAAGGLLRRRARCAFARGGLVLVFLLFVVFFLLLVGALRHDRGAGAAKVRLAAVEGHRARRGAARDEPLIEVREEAADARAQAEHGVRDQAERRQEAGSAFGRLVLPFFLLDLFFVVVFNRPSRASRRRWRPRRSRRSRWRRRARERGA